MKKNITKYKIEKGYIFKIDNFLEKKFLKKIIKEIKKLEKTSETKKFFYKEKLIKKEYNNYKNYHNSQKKLIEYISSKNFKKEIKSLLNIKNVIYSDKSGQFSGFSISKKNSYLRPHVDFNYNSSLKKFRSINLLIYFNDNWKKNFGGNLNIYNRSNNKKIHSFLPKKNRCIIFLTNKYSVHGFDKIKTDKKRISFNFYYYTKENLSYDKNIHKTIWR
jgi:Rps23 Pro-64 3,4-dihydroxylase Tpa1-like proline 4-hydroxylase